MNDERAGQGIIKSTDSDCHPMPDSLGFIRVPYSSPSSKVSITSLRRLQSSHSPFSGLLGIPTYMTRLSGHLISSSGSSQLASFLCASQRLPQLVHFK